MMLKRFHVAVALALVASSLMGCASLRGPAQSLATTGEAAASASVMAMRSTGTRLDLLMDREVIRGVLDPSLPPPTDEMKASVREAQEAYAARVKLFESLEAFYASFGAMAAYDAAAEVSSATGELTSAINGYAEKVGQPAAISGPTGQLINLLASSVATSEQNYRLKKANAIAIEILPKIIGLLEEEKAIHASVWGTMANVEIGTAILLFQNDVGFADEILKEALGDVGLVYDSKSGRAAVAKSQPLREAVEGVLEERARRRGRVPGDVATSSVRALERLLVEHKKFEKGQPLDLAGVTSMVGQIRAMVELFASDESE